LDIPGEGVTYCGTIHFVSATGKTGETSRSTTIFRAVPLPGGTPKNAIPLSLSEEFAAERGRSLSLT